MEEAGKLTREKAVATGGVPGVTLTDSDTSVRNSSACTIEPAVAKGPSCDTSCRWRTMTEAQDPLPHQLEQGRWFER